ncbi:MAG: hypothetical protein ACPGWS_07590, partial [Solirubrobacterales bacterium]
MTPGNSNGTEGPGGGLPNPFYTDQPGSPEEFRARQLRAREMLKGDIESDDFEKYVEEAVMLTTLDKAL